MADDWSDVVLPPETGTSNSWSDVVLPPESSPVPGANAQPQGYVQRSDRIGQPVDAIGTMPPDIGGEQDTNIVELPEWSHSIGVEPPARKQLNNIGDFCNNIASNFGDLAHTVGALGTAGALRLSETLPTKLATHPVQAMVGLGKNFSQHPLQTLYNTLTLPGKLSSLAGSPITGSRPLLRKEDAGLLGNMAGQAIQGTLDRYVVPFEEKGLVGGAQDVMRYAGENPLYAALDVSVARGMGGGAVAGVAGKLAAIPAVARAGEVANVALKGAVSRAGEVANVALKGAVSRGVELTPNWIKEPIQAGVETVKDWRTVSDIIGKKSFEWQEEFRANAGWVAEAYAKVKGKYTDQDLMDIVTLADPEKYAKAMASPSGKAIAEFMNRVEKANQYVGQALIEAGAMTLEESKIATYGDYVMNGLRKKLAVKLVKSGVEPGAALEQANKELPHSILNTPAGYKKVLKAEAELTARRIRPVYLGIVPQGISNTVRQNLGGVFGGVSRTIKKAASQSELGDTVETRPGFLTPREKGVRYPSIHESNPFYAFEVRFAQALQYLRLRDAFKAIIDHPHFAQAEHGEPFQLRAYFTQLAQGSGMSAPDWTKFAQGLPEIIHLPEMAIDRLKSALTADNPGWFAGNPIFAVPNNAFKLATLGVDMGWAIMQQAQNSIILHYAMWQGPKDIAASTMALFLALDKRTHAKLGPAFLYLDHTERVAIELPGVFGNIIAPLNWWVDKVFGVATAGDNVHRAAIAIYSLIHAIEEAEPAVRLGLTDAFNITARWQQVEKALSSAAYSEKAIQQTKRWMGDYSAEFSEKVQDIRTMLPFYLWLNQSLWFTSEILTKRPMKAFATKEAWRLRDQLQQGVDEIHKKMDMIPVTDENGQPMAGPNGGQLLYGRGGFMPLSQLPELIKQGYSLCTRVQPEADREGIPPVNPLIAACIGLAGRNSGNWQQWSDPSLINTGGHSYQPGPDDTGVPVEASPGIGQLALRSVFPRQEAALRAGLAYPFVPSDMTTIGEQHARRNGESEKLKAFSPLEQAWQTITKSKPTEINTDQDQIDSINQAQQRKYRKALRYQEPKLND